MKSIIDSYKPGDNSWMRKVPGSVYDKWNISVVIVTQYYVINAASDVRQVINTDRHDKNWTIF
jgi:hypothetical protein